MSEGHDDRGSGEPSDTGERADSGERVDDPFESLLEANGEGPFEWLDTGADLGERTPAEETALFEAVDVGVDLTETPWEPRLGRLRGRRDRPDDRLGGGRPEATPLSEV